MCFESIPAGLGDFLIARSFIQFEGGEYVELVFPVRQGSGEARDDGQLKLALQSSVHGGDTGLQPKTVNDSGRSSGLDG